MSWPPLCYPAAGSASRHGGRTRSDAPGVSMIGREPTSDCSKEQNAALSWRRGHGHPCSCLCFYKQATAPSLCTFTRAVASTIKSLKSHSSSSIAGVISPATLCSCICSTRTARIRCTKSTCNVQKLRERVASDVALSAQHPQSTCLFATKKPTTHTPWSEQTTRASVFTPTAHKPNSTASEATR